MVYYYHAYIFCAGGPYRLKLRCTPELSFQCDTYTPDTHKEILLAHLQPHASCGFWSLSWWRQNTKASKRSWHVWLVFQLMYLTHVEHDREWDVRAGFTVTNYFQKHHFLQELKIQHSVWQEMQVWLADSDTSAITATNYATNHATVNTTAWIVNMCVAVLLLSAKKTKQTIHTRTRSLISL